MVSIADDERAARALGMSYGKYKAMTYKPDMHTSPKTKRARRRVRQRRYTDEQLFALWQAGKSDSEIGAAVGVSRSIIQRWRDVLELPSTHKEEVDTERYRLDQLPDGTYVVLCEDCDI